eukprot:TRINITY_DN6534_c0_g1_i4.p1 TRINITY_DN6534_c0_g1~~TRINITY_DN6534_c0_g1_i4.p1  ORF type:complete len:255 (-),score=34.22 TRINITY_DN6534_c0_g1_i4:606-1370(-)
MSKSVKRNSEFEDEQFPLDLESVQISSNSGVDLLEACNITEDDGELVDLVISELPKGKFAKTLKNMICDPAINEAVLSNPAFTKLVRHIQINEQDTDYITHSTEKFCRNQIGMDESEPGSFRDDDSDSEVSDDDEIESFHSQQSNLRTNKHTHSHSHSTNASEHHYCENCGSISKPIKTPSRPRSHSSRSVGSPASPPSIPPPAVNHSYVAIAIGCVCTLTISIALSKTGNTKSASSILDMLRELILSISRNNK